MASAIIHDNILSTMGNTPIVRLNKVARTVEAQLLAKVEFFNPGGSIKDRIGIQIIEDAEQNGTLKPGGTIIEGTSGNTGVGLAIAAALRGYKCIFVMPDKMSQEKIQLLRAFGARVVVTPTNVEPDDPRSYYSVSARLVEETPNSILANQYHNPSNPKTHVLTTGPELWEQTGGDIDVVVCGVGTGGTITGLSRYLKAQNPNIKIVGVDPVGSILYAHFKTGQMVAADSYKIEGIGEDFIPTAYDPTLVDDLVQVNDKESFLMTRRLVREEGIFCGVSSGSAVVGAMRYASQQNLGAGVKILVILPDSGSRYLSKAFNDDWMRENSMLDPVGLDASIETLLDRRAPQDLILATCDEPVESVIQKMRHYNISQLPVLESNSQGLRGLVREVDLLDYMLSDTGDTDTSLENADVITADVATVQSQASLDKLKETFSTHSVAIVQEDGEVRDIITKIDLIDFLAHGT